MPWMTHQQSGFRYKTMVYQQSCYPCSLQMILTNLGRYNQSDDIENRWNQLQEAANRPNLNQQAPTENDVHRNLAQTDLRGAGARIITPTMMGAGLNQQAFQQEAQGFLNGQNSYIGMLIGVGHATVVYRTQNGFVHVNPSTDVNSIRVEFAQQINVQVVQGDNDYALRVTGVGNPNFVIAGNFIALLR